MRSLWGNMPDRWLLLRLLRFLKPFVGLVALAVLLGSATVASGIGLVGTSAWLISAAALHPSIAVLQVAIVGVRFFGLSRGVFRYLERLASHSANFRLLAGLRIWFYQQLEPLAPAVLWQERSGDLLARAVSDIEILENFFVRAVAPPLAAGVITLGMGLWVGRFDFSLGMLLMLFLLLGGITAPLLLRLLSRVPGQQVVSRRAALQAELVDGIQGMPDLLACSRQQDYLARIDRLGDGLAQAQGVMGWLSALQAGFSVLLPSLCLWGMLAAAVPLVRSSRLDGIDLACLVLASLASFEAVLPLSQAAQMLESCLAAARRLFNLASRSPAVTDPASALPLPQDFTLEVRGLSFAYAPQASLVLDGISLRLAPGQRSALVGPSGAGKSTLAHLLLRLWDYQQGEILLGGANLRSLRQEDVRRSISLVTQSTYLFDATLRQNLLLAAPGAQQVNLDEALHLAQLDEFVRSLPEGDKTWIGEHGLRLSGGQRQRLGIARSLLRRAPILVLDEPTSQLDAVNAGEFLRLLLQLPRSGSLLLITHQLASLEEMDEILVMDAGRIVQRGTHAVLLRSEGLYRQRWECQQGIW
jgi:ATP-binding cassette subfamily C protein CydC